MKSRALAFITGIILVTGCEKSVTHETASHASAQPVGLLEIAMKDSPDRIKRDAQGNVIELDLRGLPLSDHFVQSLLSPDLKWLQKFSISGEWITDQTISALSSNQPFPIYREIVFENTSIPSPEDHTWVKEYRRQHRTKLVFVSKENKT